MNAVYLIMENCFTFKIRIIYWHVCVGITIKFTSKKANNIPKKGFLLIIPKYLANLFEKFIIHHISSHLDAHAPFSSFSVSVHNIFLWTKI